MLFNWIPILFFIGFSGGLNRNGSSSTTYKYDKETCIITSSTWYTKNDEKLIKKFLYKDESWYSFPEMKKCNKKDIELYNTHRIFYNG